MLCVSIVEASVEAARRAIDEARRAGAFVELRIDAFDSEIRRDPEAIASLVRGRPAILTHRRPADGGLSESAETDRLHTLASAAKQSGAWCDIELDSAEAIDRLELDRSRVLVSHHDMESTPEDLARVVDRLLAVPVAMAKIATMAVRTSDQFAHVEQLERARTAGRSLVAIAMGEKGTATRILGPAWGAPFTFCAVTSGRESAAGQVPLSLMRDRYRADRLTRQSFVIGLIAGRTTYSRSPAMHNRVLAETSTNGVYLPFAVDDLQEFLAATVRPATRRVPWTIRGFSVTNPHKTRAAELVDELDPLARRVGAINTIVVGNDGRLTGFNTDVEGAMGPLEEAVGSLVGARIGVIGAGGAARAVVAGLAERGARTTVFARELSRAREVAGAFGADAGELCEIGSAELDVLVNATPVGTSGDTEGESPVPANVLKGVGLVFDLVYAPERTRLLIDAEARGCRTLGGRPMLAAQAARQFELWTGTRVSAEQMTAAWSDE